MQFSAIYLQNLFNLWENNYMAVVIGQTTWQLSCNVNVQESITLSNCALGSITPRGGRLICKSLGIYWIAAPSTSDVSRTWCFRDDAVTTAIACTQATTGWFIPTCAQLYNPGFTCRTYWDPIGIMYWSNTEAGPTFAWTVHFGTGGIYNTSYKSTTVRNLRAFRCVTY